MLLLHDRPLLQQIVEQRTQQPQMPAYATAIDIADHLRHLRHRFTPSGSRLTFARQLLEFFKKHGIPVTLFGSYATETALRNISTIDVAIQHHDPAILHTLTDLLHRFAEEHSQQLQWHFEGNRLSIIGGSQPEHTLHCYLVVDPTTAVELPLPGGQSVTAFPLALPQHLAEHPYPHIRAVLHLLKLWRTLKNIPLPSAYMDAMGLQALEDLPADTDLPTALQTAITYCIDTALQPLSSPVIAPTPLQPHLEPFDRETTLRKFRTVRERLAAIREAEAKADAERTFQLWNLLFTGALSR